MSWQGELAAAAAAASEREREVWVVTMVDPPLLSDVWCTRTRDGTIGTDLAMYATCYEFRIVSEIRNCEDGQHVHFRFDPPIESMRVRRENMTNVVTALRTCGFHAKCSDGAGKHYEF